MGALIITPLGVARSVTVGADIVQPLEVWPGMAFETVDLAVPAWQLDGGAGCVNLLPRLHGCMAAGTGELLAHVVGAVMTQVATGHLGIVGAVMGPENRFNDLRHHPVPGPVFFCGPGGKQEIPATYL